MALSCTVINMLDDSQPLYIRIANISDVSKDGSSAIITARGYASSGDFVAKKRHRWERTFDFTPDISQPLWPQAYAVLKGSKELATSTDV